MSKKVWMKEQRTAEPTPCSDQYELERRVRLEVTLQYLHQRLQLLKSRKMNNAVMMKEIITYIYTRTCYQKLREDTTDEQQDDIIDLTDEPAFTQESTSKAQLTRVTLQCFVVYNTMQKVYSRDEKEALMLRNVLNKITVHGADIEKKALVEDIMTQDEIEKKQFRLLNSMGSVADEVRLLTANHIFAKTIRAWYHEHMDNKSFKEDCRGSHDRVTFLEEYGYSLRFKLYLKNEKKLTVDVATKELEAIISRDPLITEDRKKAFEILRPFSRRTVHRWMLKLGCKYETAIVVYYTDSHEAEETKKDFKERLVSTSMIIDKGLL